MEFKIDAGVPLRGYLRKGKPSPYRAAFEKMNEGDSFVVVGWQRTAVINAGRLDGHKVVTRTQEDGSIRAFMVKKCAPELVAEMKRKKIDRFKRWGEMAKARKAQQSNKAVTKNAQELQPFSASQCEKPSRLHSLSD